MSSTLDQICLQMNQSSLSYYSNVHQFQDALDNQNFYSSILFIANIMLNRLCFDIVFLNISQQTHQYKLKHIKTIWAIACDIGNYHSGAKASFKRTC